MADSGQSLQVTWRAVYSLKAFDFGVGASFYVNATTQKYK
jgi:hypothetical protein